MKRGEIALIVFFGILAAVGLTVGLYFALRSSKSKKSISPTSTMPVVTETQPERFHLYKCERGLCVPDHKNGITIETSCCFTCNDTTFQCKPSETGNTLTVCQQLCNPIPKLFACVDNNCELSGEGTMSSAECHASCLATHIVVASGSIDSEPGDNIFGEYISLTTKEALADKYRIATISKQTTSDSTVKIIDLTFMDDDIKVNGTPYSKVFSGLNQINHASLGQGGNTLCVGQAGVNTITRWSAFYWNGTTFVNAISTQPDHLNFVGHKNYVVPPTKQPWVMVNSNSNFPTGNLQTIWWADDSQFSNPFMQKSSTNIPDNVQNIQRTTAYFDPDSNRSVAVYGGNQGTRVNFIGPSSGSTFRYGPALQQSSSISLTESCDMMSTTFSGNVDLYTLDTLDAKVNHLINIPITGLISFALSPSGKYAVYSFLGRLAVSKVNSSTGVLTDTEVFAAIKEVDGSFIELQEPNDSR